MTVDERFLEHFEYVNEIFDQGEGEEREGKEESEEREDKRR